MTKRLYAHVLLDRSGSMISCRKQAISAFNEYVAGLLHTKGVKTRVSLTLFDSVGIDLIHDNLKAADVPKLTEETFVPCGGTPLYDAIGTTVAHIDGIELKDKTSVSLAIITDGHENMSREYSLDAVQRLLKDRQDKKKWLVQYLGANQDGLGMGQKMGVSAGTSMTFSDKHIGEAMKTVVRSNVDYAREGTAASASYTTEERNRAVGK